MMLIHVEGEVCLKGQMEVQSTGDEYASSDKEEHIQCLEEGHVRWSAIAREPWRLDHGPLFSTHLGLRGN